MAAHVQHHHESSTRQFLRRPRELVVDQGPRFSCLWLAGSFGSLSVASDLGSSFRLLLKLLLNPFATALSVVCRVPHGTANQTLGGETKPLKHLPVEANSRGDDWWVNFCGCAPLSPLAPGTYTRMLTSPARSPSGDHGGSHDAQHEFFVPSLLSTELSHRPASDHS